MSSGEAKQALPPPTRVCISCSSHPLEASADFPPCACRSRQICVGRGVPIGLDYVHSDWVRFDHFEYVLHFKSSRALSDPSRSDMAYCTRRHLLARLNWTDRSASSTPLLVAMSVIKRRTPIWSYPLHVMLSFFGNLAGSLFAAGVFGYASGIVSAPPYSTCAYRVFKSLHVQR